MTLVASLSERVVTPRAGSDSRIRAGVPSYVYAANAAARPNERAVVAARVSVPPEEIATEKWLGSYLHDEYLTTPDVVLAACIFHAVVT